MRRIVSQAARRGAALARVEQPDRCMALVGFEIIGAQRIDDVFTVGRDFGLRESPQTQEILDVERIGAGAGEEPHDCGEEEREVRPDLIISGASVVHGQ